MAIRPHNFRALSKPKQLQKREHRHYLPYLPLLILVLGTFFISLVQPVGRHGVLSYATSMSTDSLLNATNLERSKAGATNLHINAALAQAAQTKANDMVARNYWSHNTPDGKEPWVFIDATGYKYQKAGENLAYGFQTSSATVGGWMNSASHRQNLLDGAYTEVGFGYANGENYNKSGNETVVVAMYGRPYVLGAGTTSGAMDTQLQTPTKSTPVNTDAVFANEPISKPVARVQALTGGSASWSLFAAGLVVGIAIVLLLVKHAVRLRHLVRDSEQFILHHTLLDTVLVSLVLVGSFLSQTTGFIR